jgi:hypothetical protein
MIGQETLEVVSLKEAQVLISFLNPILKLEALKLGLSPVCPVP